MEGASNQKHIWAASGPRPGCHNPPKVYSADGSKTPEKQHESSIVIQLKVDPEKEGKLRDGFLGDQNSNTFCPVSVFDQTDVFVAQPLQLPQDTEKNVKPMWYDPNDVHHIGDDECSDKKVSAEDTVPSS